MYTTYMIGENEMVAETQSQMAVYVVFFLKFNLDALLDLLGTGIGGPLSKNDKVLLPDHRPFCLNTDDYQRVCRIPKKKVCKSSQSPRLQEVSVSSYVRCCS